MSDKPEDTPRIHVDDDWKVEAAREKQKLAEETKDVGSQGPLPKAAFAEIANMIVMQALVALGGMATPEGRKIPPDLHAAKHHIDLLGVLAEKTRGNLSEEEAKLLETAQYELQMRFVQVVGSAPQEAKPAGN
jgi:hypothetical protein